jgi:hypothetical protein
MIVGMAVAGASILAPMPATAQEEGSSALKTGTTFAYRGVMVPEGKCTEYVTYEQYAKVSGSVILPETAANVYNFIEYWGRDSGTQILRISPSGKASAYFNRIEYHYPLFDKVGASFEMTDPESGESLRLVIVGVGITRTLPTGAVYENLTQMNMYCISCGPEPMLMESRWYSREFPFGVLFRADNSPCWPRWHWLVSVTRK